MQYVHLGRSGLLVSRLCLGTMNFGRYTEEGDSHAILNAALEAGINFIDTANAYGRPRGTTEEIIGRWLADRPERRRQIVLATKVYSQMGEGPNDQRLSAWHIRQACDDSLRRLQTDHIDLYQMHHIDRNTPWEEVWEAFEQLHRQGKVIYFGSSNFAGWHIAQANERAAARNFFGLVSEQCLYNLAVRDVETDVLPACANYGLAVIPWSPLAQGKLAGILAKMDERGRRHQQVEQHKIDPLRPQIEAYEQLCNELSAPPARVALAWLLHQVDVTSPIIGPRTMEQLTDSLPALELVLDQETLRQLNEIWPGPKGPAPEAFAW